MKRCFVINVVCRKPKKIFSNLSQREVVNIKSSWQERRGIFISAHGMGSQAEGGGSTIDIFLVENQFNALGLTPILEINSNKNVGNLRRKGRTRRIEK